MLPLQFLAKLVKILRSGVAPGEIAGGFILGMIIGLTPFWSLHNLLVVLLIIILNVNISSAIFGFMVFSLIAYIFDPLFHSFGFFLLTDINALTGVWTSMYNTPILALSRFNNTVVMGSLVASLILLIPIFYLSKTGVVKYRENLEPKVQKLKIVQVLKGSQIYNFYEKVKNIGG